MNKILSEEMLESPKIKGSRFVGYIFYVEKKTEIEEKLTFVRKQHPHASHICYAWILQNGEERCSDDGEPRGSAGMPILQRLKSYDLIHVLGVSVRYFGGQKLGVGGLIRAYGNSVGLVLQQSKIQEIVPMQNLTIIFDYDLDSTVKKILIHYQEYFECKNIQHKYSHHIQTSFHLPVAHVVKITEELKEECSGRIRFVDATNKVL